MCKLHQQCKIRASYSGIFLVSRHGWHAKLLAALRGGIKQVLIPQDNAKDLPDIPDNVKESLDIVTVSSLDEVLEKALVSEVTPIEWEPESEDVNPVPGEDGKGSVGTVTTH